MDPKGLLRTASRTVVFLVFLIALCGSEASASNTNVGAAQDDGILTHAVSQAPSDGSKTLPATSKDAGNMTAPPIRVGNSVACYSICVVGCNPRQETPAKPCQKRCAKHCWK